MQSINFKRAALVAFAISSVFFLPNTSFAQETPAIKVKPMDVRIQPEQKQMSWEEYKADLKSKYQKVTDEANSIEKQAAEKKIEAPDFKELINNFQAEAKEFNIHLKNADIVPVERQEQFKADM